MARSHPASLDKPDATIGAPSLSHVDAPTDRISFLRMSAAERLLGASVVVTLLWAAVYWALH
jgi:hypothetical protein